MKWPWSKDFDRPPLDSQELTDLATYNSERHRGLVHTQEYADMMARLQVRYDDWVEERNRASGYVTWLATRESEKEQ